MGNLLDYYIIESVVDYDNDPLKIGRIKCTIPGVVHSDSTPEEGMPWVRCFKMGAYQTFSRPIKGQKVWVMISKQNQNEFWYFPFHEAIDITKDYIEEYYNENCDVLHARHSGNGDCMMTYDDEQGYLTKIGDDHINLTPKRQFELDCDNKRISIEDDIVYIGDKDKGAKQVTIKGENHQKWISTLSGQFASLAEAAGDIPYTIHLSALLQAISSTLAQNSSPFDIYTKHTKVN